MADNISVSSVTGTVLVGTKEEAGGVHHQRVKPQASVDGGCSSYHLVTAASTNAANIKASPGQVYGAHGFNLADYPIYFKLHNTAGTPTAGTGVVRTLAAQAGQPFSYPFPVGLQFTAGIGITVTKGITDADATAVLAADGVIDLDWT